jgi:hypothetical protein
MVSFIVLAHICEQAHQNRGKGFRMISHLQSNDASEERGRIVDDVREITVERDQYGFERLRTFYYVRIFRVDWQMSSQQFDRVASIS